MSGECATKSISLSVLSLLVESIEDDLAHEVEYLHPADDGEAGEEAHGAAYSGQHV